MKDGKYEVGKLRSGGSWEVVGGAGLPGLDGGRGWTGSGWDFHGG